MSEFVDECGLNVRGGDGGAGSVSFRREAHTPMGGPDGGDGGDGGDVWLVADRNTASLIAFRDHPHRKATSGTHGSGKKRHGHAGDDIEVLVPIGTQVRTQEGRPLADLTREGDRWLAAEGGRGGRGNAKFLSNRRRAPGFAEQGEEGEEHWMVLELKLLADVALVGFPNVGKSTLISRVSAAKPKIADYPFTTLVPNLGVVRTDDGFEMVIADIPGLIEGAAEGRGLGHQFLRHIERSRVLVVMLDLAEFAEAAPAEQLEVLLTELGDYRPELLARPRLVIGSRADMATAETLASLEQLDPQALVVSAVTGQGTAELIGSLRQLVEEERETESDDEGFVTLRPTPEGVDVVRHSDGSLEVLGREARRAVALSDLNDPDALEEARRRLDALGVNRALRRAGARDGDTVVIGDFAFEFDDNPVADLGGNQRRTARERKQ
ncbi:MAG: GTPase ObgE [Actinomycetia bacterium]|nr:GTPase ObgE [Actinomycetes bacterium]